MRPVMAGAGWASPYPQHCKRTSAIPRRIRARVVQVIWPSGNEEGAGNAG